MVYDFFIGDDISTLNEPNTGAGYKLLAVASITSNFTPGGGLVKGLKLVGKGLKKGVANTGPKLFGIEAHNQKIAEVADLVTDGKIIAGGQRLPEKSLKTPGGTKSSRRPNILVEKPDRTQYGINVGKITKSGAPVKREVEAIYDLEDIGLPMYFVPYK